MVGGAVTVIGVRGRSLSCTDKIARWQALGVEGALLSMYLAVPLRLSAVIVGRKFDAERCARAMVPALRGDARGGSSSTRMRWAEARFTLERARASARDSKSSSASDVSGAAAATIGRAKSGDGDESLSWDAGEDEAAPRRRHDGRTGRPLSWAGRRGCARSPISSGELFADWKGLVLAMGRRGVAWEEKGVNAAKATWCGDGEEGEGEAYRRAKVRHSYSMCVSLLSHRHTLPIPFCV